MNPLLPFVSWSPLEPGSNFMEVTVLCHAQFSHGTGRFLSDLLSRRLIPGKIVELGGTRTLSFFFSPDDKQEYLINQRLIIENDLASMDLIRKNLPALAQEIQLTLLTITKARHFLSLKPENETRATLLHEMQHLTPFEELHQIIRRLSAEKTAAEIRDYLTPYYQKRPKVFDRDIFEEIKPFTTIYNEKFIGSRNIHFIGRLVSYHFYFKRMFKERSLDEPFSRQILLKVFRGKGFLGILLGIDLFGDNEVLKKHHVIEAIRNCLPDFQTIEDSFLQDDSSEYRPIFYTEIRKEGPISSEDILTIRQKLPLELKQCIQSLSNPLFMLRNEEDQLRYMISLSRELRFVKDIPQVAISFEDQTMEDLSFSVVLLRILKTGALPLKEILTRINFKTHLREVKNIGWIRNKYPKEVAIFKVSLPKRLFLRKDHSIDLPKARQELLSELNHHFKEVRDYNGGLLSKQLENLEDLKKLLGSLAEENAFPLENYFFSLEPLIAQTTINPMLLKEGFLLLLQLMKEQSPYAVKSSKEGTLAGFIISSSEEKESYISFLETARDSYDSVSYSLTHIQDLTCLAVFYSNKDSTKQREFEDLLRCFVESKSSVPL